MPYITEFSYFPLSFKKMHGTHYIVCAFWMDSACCICLLLCKRIHISGIVFDFHIPKWEATLHGTLKRIQKVKMGEKVMFSNGKCCL